MVRPLPPGESYSLEDGLGIRRIEAAGHIIAEVLELAAELASQPVIEQAIRGRASRYADLDTRLFAPVKRIERTGSSLRIASEMPAGVRLSHLLAYLESTGEVAPESAMLELSSLVISAVASLHGWPGGLAHGAVSPAHVLLTYDGRIMLTDCAFGVAYEALQRNREQLWKEFGLAMPAAAGIARFDQQSDVTQMGALILAIVLQRPLRHGEYPRGVNDLVTMGTESLVSDGVRDSSSAIRVWLQEALQIHPRLVFRSAVEAQRSFSNINNEPASRRAGQTALQTLLRATCGEPLKQSPFVVTRPRRAEPDHFPKVPDRFEGSRSFDSALQAAFPEHGTH